LSAEKITDIYNGIKALRKVDEIEKANLKQQLLIKDDDIVLGTVARLDPIKNHEMIFNAFSYVLAYHSKAKLIVVGDGDLQITLMEQCEQLDIADKVILTRFITKPGNYIQIFNVFLLSSLSEGASMTLIEAMSLAKPCVVTDAEGSEIIQNGLNGLVTENNNLNAVSHALLQIIDDTEKLKLWEEQGKKGSQVISQLP
jgi:glycosyltransferase involved in cell wall biosynthesis